MVFYLAGPHVVAIHQLVEFRGQTVEEFLDSARELPHFAEARVGCGDVAPQRLDVNIYLEPAIAQFADFRFQITGLSMGFTEAELFIHLQVEFDEKLSGLLHGSQVMDGEAQALSSGANGFEQMFALWRTRLRMDHH